MLLFCLHTLPAMLPDTHLAEVLVVICMTYLKNLKTIAEFFFLFFPICFQITFQNKMKHSKHTPICDWHFPAQKPVRDELIFTERRKKQSNFRLEILRLERDHCCFCFQVKINVLGRYFKNLFKTTMYNIFRFKL